MYIQGLENVFPTPSMRAFNLSVWNFDTEFYPTVDTSVETALNNVMDKVTAVAQWAKRYWQT